MPARICNEHTIGHLAQYRGKFGAFIRQRINLGTDFINGLPQGFTQFHNLDDFAARCWNINFIELASSHLFSRMGKLFKRAQCLRGDVQAEEQNRHNC